MQSLLDNVLTLLALAAAGCGPSDRAADTQRDTQSGLDLAASAAVIAPLDDRDCKLATELTPCIPGSPGHLSVSPRNPNGDSELAHLMRLFVDDLVRVRAALQAGQEVEPLYDALVQGCVACHSVSRNGPLEMIDGLRRQ